jgi:hypothetical protein
VGVNQQIGLTVPASLMQLLSYHSIMPRISSPSPSTITIGVLDCICF